MSLTVDFDYRLPDILDDKRSVTYRQKVNQGVYATAVTIADCQFLPVDKVPAFAEVIAHDAQWVLWESRCAGKGEAGTDLEPKAGDQIWQTATVGWVVKEVEHPPLTARYVCKVVKAVGPQPP